MMYKLFKRIKNLTKFVKQCHGINTWNNNNKSIIIKSLKSQYNNLEKSCAQVCFSHMQFNAFFKSKLYYLKGLILMLEVL